MKRKLLIQACVKFVAELYGCAEYTRKVRSRLVPFIW